MRSLGIAVVLAMLVVSCSGDTQRASAPSEPESVVGVAQSESGDGGSEVDVLDPAGGPDVTVDEGEIPVFSAEEAAAVVAVLGWDEPEGNSRQASIDAYNDREARIQELVAQCMRELGFDYKLELSPSATLISPPGIARGTREFATSFGFGMSTLAFSADDVSPAVGTEDSWFDDPRGRIEPREEAVEVDEAEERAFDDALFGRDRSSGCIADASSDLAPAAALVEGAAERIKVIDERAAADPERLDYLEGLTACIAQPDFELESFESFEEFLLETIVSHEIFGPDVTDSRSEAWIARLVEVQAIELQLSTAFYDCAGGEAAFANRLFDLAKRYRQPILDLLDE